MPLLLWHKNVRKGKYVGFVGLKPELFIYSVGMFQSAGETSRSHKYSDNKWTKG